jgi:Tol biopolymer transport system component
MKNTVTSAIRVWATALLSLLGCQDPPTEPEADPPRPAFAPGPQTVHRIAFVGSAFPGSPFQIYTIRQDGTGLTQVTQLSDPLSHAIWSPAGPSRIAFRISVGPDTNESNHVAVIGSNGSGFQDLTPTGVGLAAIPVWSPDGDRIAFIDGAQPADRLMVMNADGSGLTQLASSPQLRGPAWSPDGEKLAYYTEDVPRTLSNERGIWSVKPDGTGRTKLQSTVGITYLHMHFSPDGTKMLLCRRRYASGDTEVIVLNANGTGWVNLGVTCGAIVYDHSDDAQWSPDGTRILTSHNYNLYTLSPSGGNLTQLTFDGTASLPNGVGRWSRQGTKIAYIRDTYGAAKLYVMSADGSSKQLLTPSTMKVFEHTWGP